MTTIVVMPDTEPVIDQVALVDFIQRRARDNAAVNVHVMAAMTRGLKGQEITEIGLLKRAGAVAFTNGKNSIAAARVMRNALLYSKDFGALIVHHTEDPTLTEGTVMNSGEVATRLGLRGVHKAAETIVVGATCVSWRSRGALSRFHAHVRREPRGGAGGEGARPARHLRRLGEPPHPQRERHRPLSHLLPPAPPLRAEATAWPWCAASPPVISM